MLNSSGCHWKCWIKPVPASIPQQETFQLPILCPENWPLNLAFCILFINFLFVRLLPPILWQLSFFDNLWCGTLSKAFSKLDCTVSAGPPLSVLTDALWWLRWVGEAGFLFAEAMQHLFQQATFIPVYSDFIFIAPTAFSKDGWQTLWSVIPRISSVLWIVFWLVVCLLIVWFWVFFGGRVCGMWLGITLAACQLPDGSFVQYWVTFLTCSFVYKFHSTTSGESHGPGDFLVSNL